MVEFQMRGRGWGVGEVSGEHFVGPQDKHSTCLLLRDGGGTEADSDDDDGSEATEQESKVEVVEVLQHGWPPVYIPASWSWV